MQMLNNLVVTTRFPGLNSDSHGFLVHCNIVVDGMLENWKGRFTFYRSIVLSEGRTLKSFALSWKS
jgi:hypothetical protein